MNELSRTPILLPVQYRRLIEASLEEDLGSAGDITSAAVIDPDLTAKAVLVARQSGRLCGLDIAVEVFRTVDPELVVEISSSDGSDVEGGQQLVVLTGRARSILAAERTALNFLGHLSGIATVTRDLQSRIERFGCRLVCTRKTTPAMRGLEKYAVRVGGATNHRFGLYDAVLIKDNHRVLVDDLSDAIGRAKAEAGHNVRVEVEVDDLDQLDQVLDAGVDAVLLDNMSKADLRSAVERCRGKATTEASGGIGPDTIESVAATGVDLISVGWITHSAPSLDVALDLVPVAPPSTRDEAKSAC